MLQEIILWEPLEFYSKSEFADFRKYMATEEYRWEMADANLRYKLTFTIFNAVMNSISDNDLVPQEFIEMLFDPCVQLAGNLVAHYKGRFYNNGNYPTDDYIKKYYTYKDFPISWADYAWEINSFTKHREHTFALVEHQIEPNVKRYINDFIENKSKSELDTTLRQCVEKYMRITSITLAAYYTKEYIPGLDKTKVTQRQIANSFRHRY